MRTRTAPMASAAMLLLLVNVAGGSAHAQSTAPDAPIGLSASASLEAAYDDNIFRSTTTFAGQRKGDFRFSPSVSLRYDMPVARQGFYVEGHAGRTFYTRNTEFDRTYWGAGAGVNWRLGMRCSGSLGADYSRRQSDFADLGIALNNIEKRQHYAFDANCAGPAGIGLVAGADYTKTDNTRPSRILGDLRSYSYYGGLLYRSILVGDITLRWMHEDRKYPNRFITTGATTERDGLKVDRVSLAVTRPLGARLTGSAGISYIWTKPDISVYSKFKGVGWNGDLSYLVSPRLSFGITASRDVTSSAAIDSSYQITRTIGGWATYKLSERTSLSVGANDQRRKYRGEYNNPLLPFSIPLRSRENTQHYYAQVGYDPSQRWSMSLRYEYSKRHSDVGFYDYSGNSVIFNTTVRY